MLQAAQLHTSATGGPAASPSHNQPFVARSGSRAWLPVPMPQMVPCSSARQVVASAQRGRRAKSAIPAPEEPAAAAPADASTATATRTRRKSATRSKTVGVEGHEGLVTLMSPTEANEDAVKAREFYAEQQIDEALHLQPGQGQLDMGMQQPASLAHRPATQMLASSREPEVETGNYGVAAGLPDDGYEKSVLREQIGHDIYRPLRADAQENPILPRKYQPVTGGMREYYDLRFNLERMYWETRQAHREYVHDLAFAAHHYTRERAVNIYANMRRVAGLMAAFENDDHKLQNLAPSNIASFARAEIAFYPEHEEFNQMLQDNMEQIVRRPPKEAAEEELDLLDEALFMLRPDDDNTTSQRVGQQGAEQELLDQYLEGLLPGATLDNLSATYAQDIFSSEMDDYVDEESLFGKAAGTDQKVDDATEEEQAAV